MQRGSCQWRKGFLRVAASSNKSVNADAQGRSPLRGSIPLVAGYLRR